MGRGLKYIYHAICNANAGADGGMEAESVVWEAAAESEICLELAEWVGIPVTWERHRVPTVGGCAVMALYIQFGYMHSESALRYLRADLACSGKYKQIKKKKYDGAGKG